MAMRMDPPPPPETQGFPVWWSRVSRDAELGNRTLYAKIVQLEAPAPWGQWDGTVFRVLVEFYADRSIGPGLVQRYGSLETAQQVLERRGWSPHRERFEP